MSRIDEMSRKVEMFAEKAQAEIRVFTKEAKKTILEEKLELDKNKVFKEYAKKIYEQKKQRKNNVDLLITNMMYEIDELNRKIDDIKKEN
jgi:nitrogenase subunit NifH